MPCSAGSPTLPCGHWRLPRHCRCHGTAARLSSKLLTRLGGWPSPTERSPRGIRRELPGSQAHNEDRPLEAFILIIAEQLSQVARVTSVPSGPPEVGGWGVWAGGPQTSALCLVLSPSAHRPQPCTSVGGRAPQCCSGAPGWERVESGHQPLLCPLPCPREQLGPSAGDSVFKCPSLPTPGLGLAGQEDGCRLVLSGQQSESSALSLQGSQGPPGTPRGRSQLQGLN